MNHSDAWFVVGRDLMWVVIFLSPPTQMVGVFNAPHETMVEKIKRVEGLYMAILSYFLAIGCAYFMNRV